jgi:hypothetical protein
MEVEPNQEPIAGVLTTTNDEPQPFTGWLELASMIETARQGQSAATDNPNLGNDRR